MMDSSRISAAVSAAEARDYTSRYNTKLSPADEKKFRKWAKETGREGDLYDYDLRGAWRELQSGSMREDERGHLGDKYKKPNHPTFSTESIYSSDSTPGGQWSEDAQGRTVYTPSDFVVSQQGADRLKRYFSEREKGAVLNIGG